jgi:hypothetical protein
MPIRSAPLSSDKRSAVTDPLQLIKIVRNDSCQSVISLKFAP